MKVLGKNVRQVVGSKVRTYIEDREFGENSTKLLVKRVLGKPNLSHVEIPYATNFEVFVDHLKHCQLLDSVLCMQRTVGVFRWVLDRTMSRKSDAVGTGAIAFNPLVDIVISCRGRWAGQR